MSSGIWKYVHQPQDGFCHRTYQRLDGASYIVFLSNTIGRTITSKLPYHKYRLPNAIVWEIIPPRYNMNITLTN